MTDKEYLKKLGANIARIRKEKKIQQVDLAYECNFEKSNMSRIESGNTNPTILTLRKIGAALSVKVTDLLPPKDNA